MKGKLAKGKIVFNPKAFTFDTVELSDLKPPKENGLSLQTTKFKLISGVVQTFDGVSVEITEDTEPLRTDVFENGKWTCVQNRMVEK